MNTKRTFPPWIALAASGLALLVGCDKSIPSQEAGGSDEIDTRLVVDRTGKPVAGARIALVRSGDSTGTAQAVSATGSDGSFPAFVVPDGSYSVLLRDPGDSLGRYLDSVHVVSHRLPAGRDTLLSLATVRGVVRLGSGDSPTSVTVGLLGTDILANVKADGTFDIELVPGGLYTLGALTSLDGYGRIYKRIQVSDGQKMTLPDTLVLPFSGLPVPAGLRVLQDTATGNVHVSWNRVVHPDLMGYVLERVEGGSVISSRYLTDTAWTDSLGAYWEALPLLGPWPSRAVAYRVCSRSLSGAVDTKSAALAISAKPPEWTKRVDSVKVSMTTDTVTGVSTLKWNQPVHPNLVEWRVIRTVLGGRACLDTVRNGEWVDSACGDPRVDTISEQVGEVTGAKTIWINQRSVNVGFNLQAIRNLSVENVAVASKQLFFPSLVVWRDSGLLTSSVDGLRSFGGWIEVVGSANSLMPRKNSMVSKDGIHWEEVPDQGRNFGMNIVGFSDSLWIVQKVDSFRIAILHRKSANVWIPDTLVIGNQPRCADDNHIQFMAFSKGPIFYCNGSDSGWLVGGKSAQPIWLGLTGFHMDAINTWALRADQDLVMMLWGSQTDYMVKVTVVQNNFNRG